MITQREVFFRRQCTCTAVVSFRRFPFYPFHIRT
nr:MAG TPA: hypothetical protein [Caudoviricetes sp.]